MSTRTGSLTDLPPESDAAQESAQGAGTATDKGPVDRGLVGEGLEGADLDAAIIAADHTRVFHSWSAQAHLPSMSIAGGRGAWLWDHAGHRWLDFTSQLVDVNIGYQHPAVVAAIRDQAARLTTIAPATSNRARATAAGLILDHAGPGFEKVFFTNAGADANENAIRMARLFTGRETVISAWRSYHGNTGTAITATGDWRRIPNEYARGHLHVFTPYPYRSPFWADSPEEETQRALEHLEATIDAQGPATVAAILLETVPGTAGILVPPPGYLQGVRDIADRHGIVLICDEVMAGFGRTGSWFAFQQQGIVPDLVTFAKGVNSGYVPAGGVIISPAIAHHFDEQVFPGGLTYSGHPLAMAAAVATMRAMDEEHIVEHAAHIGAQILGPGLAALESSPLVGEVRGLGVFWAVELVADKTTRQPLPARAMARIAADCKAHGLLVDPHDNRIHVVPPCIITDRDASTGVGILADALGREADR